MQIEKNGIFMEIDPDYTFKTSENVTIAQEKAMFEMAREEDPSFFTPAETFVSEVKVLKGGIRFMFKKHFRFLVTREMFPFIVECTKRDDGRWWYAYGSNLNPVEQMVLIEHFRLTHPEKLS